MGTDIEKLVDLMIQERMQSQFAKWREAETGKEKKADYLRLETEYEKAISVLSEEQKDAVRHYSMKFSKSIQRQLVEVQKDFMPEDTEAGQIQGFLEHYTGSMVCSKQIFKEALGYTYDEPKRWQLHNINEIIQHLFLRINQSFPYRQIRRLNVHTASRKNKALNVLFHVQFLNDCTADDSNDKPQQHIDDGYFCAKNADEQDKTSQINHRRRDQKGECHTQRQARTRKADEQRDR